MTRQNAGAFGVIVLRLPTANPLSSRPEVHLLLDGDAGVAPRQWSDLHPDLDLSMRGRTMWSLVLSPSGRKLLARVPSSGADMASPDVKAQRLVIIDVASGQVTPTSFTEFEQVEEEHSIDDMLDFATGRKAPPSQEHRRSVTLKYAMSADDDALAVAATHRSGTDWHLTVTVVRGEQQQASAERTFPGHRVSSMDAVLDHLVQWSPDGRYLALQVREPDPQWEVKRYESLFVLDALTLETVLSLDATWLVGSASWSPDGRQLAVEHKDGSRILDVPQQRLDELAWLPGPRYNPSRQPQVLGLLSGDRALLLRRTSTPRFRLIAADLATGKGPLLAAFGTDDLNRDARPSVTRRWQELADTP
ncbi:hypothetical protein [Kineococcus sp. SYSU DK006]|uniref:hypothetical protein n=1 Tax=Kineococcus sp. SYSU DK006 TaxID=3383127 RepID=UPI003D7F0DCB